MLKMKVSVTCVNRPLRATPHLYIYIYIYKWDRARETFLYPRLLHGWTAPYMGQYGAIYGPIWGNITQFWQYFDILISLDIYFEVLYIHFEVLGTYFEVFP